MKNFYVKLLGFLINVIYVLIVFIVILAFVKFLENKFIDNYYSQLFVVRDVQKTNDSNFLVLFENNNGHQFVYISEDGDIHTNEIYTAIMYNNNTSIIMDDEIMSIKYQGEK